LIAIDIDDVNKALNDLHQSLDSRITQDVYIQQVDDQRIINEVLCQEMCLARWQWQSGQLKNNDSVIWENQCANACPENFT